MYRIEPLVPIDFGSVYPLPIAVNRTSVRSLVITYATEVPSDIPTDLFGDTASQAILRNCPTSPKALPGNWQISERRYPGRIDLAPDAANKSFDGTIELLQRFFLIIGIPVDDTTPDMIFEHQQADCPQG